MATAYVLNKSTGEKERAKEINCPNCKGFGKLFGDEEVCHICNGYGFVWISVTGSSWTRPRHKRLQSSQLF